MIQHTTRVKGTEPGDTVITTSTGSEIKYFINKERFDRELNWFVKKLEYIRRKRASRLFFESLIGYWLLKQIAAIYFRIVARRNVRRVKSRKQYYEKIYSK